eukprot:2378-Rhodomonas_salina.1
MRRLVGGGGAGARAQRRHVRVAVCARARARRSSSLCRSSSRAGESERCLVEAQLLPNLSPYHMEPSRQCLEMLSEGERKGCATFARTK